jgi:hypothetical protein
MVRAGIGVRAVPRAPAAPCPHGGKNLAQRPSALRLQIKILVWNRLIQDTTKTRSYQAGRTQTLCLDRWRLQCLPLAEQIGPVRMIADGKGGLRV